MRKDLQSAVRILGRFLWFLLGTCFALAVFYTTPVGLFLRIVFVVIIAKIFIHKNIPRLVPLALAGIYFTYYIGFVEPNPQQDWAPEHSRMPQVSVDDNLLKISNVRNFRWETATSFEEGFYDRVYDLDKLESMYYIIGTIAGIEAVGHVFLSFKFTDGQAISVSVEGRRPRGEPYQIIPSLFRRYQLIYAIGDEADVLGLRGAIWKKPVYFYPARTTPERARWILTDMLKRAEKLDSQPEFYHLLLNNCMNNITAHLRRLGGGVVPRDIQLLLTGFSDRVAHRMGLLDTELSFREARRVFRVDDIMQSIELNEDFSENLRKTLNQRLIDAGQAPRM